MVSERLKEIRKYFKVTQEEFGEKIGVKQGNVGDWERRRSSPSLSAMHSIVKHYNVNLHWLLTGQGEMLFTETPKPVDAEIVKQQVLDIVKEHVGKLEKSDALSSTEKENFWYLPVKGDIAAGSPIPFREDNDPIKYIAIPKNKLPNPMICDVLRVNGDSMEPQIEHNDFVVIRQESDWWMCHNKIVAVRMHDGVTLKKLIVDFGKKTACLMPLNNKYEAIFVDEDCELCGQLVFSVRQY